MKWERCRAFVLMLWLLPGALCGLSARAEEEAKEKAATLLLYQYDRFQKLHTLEYHWISKSKPQSSTTKEEIIDEGSFISSGDKYYREVVSKDSEGAILGVMKFGFDGELYQCFLQSGQGAGGILIFSSHPLRDDTAPSDILCSIYPFVFAPDEPAVFPKFREKKTWEKLKDMVTGYEETQFEGRKGVMLTLKQPKRKISQGDFAYYQESNFKVFLSSDFGYLPTYVLAEIRVEPGKEGAFPPSKLTQELKVTDVKLFEGFPFPRKMELVSKDGEGKIIGKYEFVVDSENLKINQKVEEGKFTLPRSDAQTIINEDTGEVIRL